MHFVYVICTLDSPIRWYIGSTSDVQLRLQNHNAGRNASTRGHAWRLVYYEAYLTPSAAQLREKQLKQDGRSRRLLMERIRSSLESFKCGGQL